MKSTSVIHNSDILKSPRPLFIPEILAVIFSFLSSHRIKTSARFVCKLWNSVGCPFIEVPVRLSLSHLTIDRYHTKINRLHLATTVYIDYRAHWENYDEDNELWSELSNKIDRIRADNNLYISKLNALFIGNFHDAIYTIIHKISCLQELSITITVDADVYLGTILTLCPNLQLFCIISHCGDRRILDTSSSLESSIGSFENRPDSSLRQLIVRGRAFVDFQSIQSIIQRCPKLEVLKLYQVIVVSSTKDSSFNRKEFFQIVSRSCRYLKCLHFSTYLRDMTISDAQLFVDTFPRTFSDKDTAMPEFQGSSLDTISLLEREFFGPISTKLLKPLMTSGFENTITKVEILTSAVKPGNICIVHALHHLLCSAPSLLELLAPPVGYFTEYLDFTIPIILDLSYPMACNSPTCNRSRHKTKHIWACRGLQRLQIRFLSTVTHYDGTSRDSRVIFDYISLVCPNLRELAIYKPTLKLELDGGFCLLSRLQYLEKLILVSHERVLLKNSDLKWMRNHPTEKSSLWNFFKTPIFSKASKGSSSHSAESSCTQANDASELPLPEDLMDIGSVNSLNACLAQLRLRQEAGGQKCWPRLEFLGIRQYYIYHPKPGKYLPSLIAKLRPEVEFSCVHDELVSMFPR